MLIAEKNKKYCLEKQIFTSSQDIMEASELLYEILNASYECSGTCLEREINGSRETIQSLYYKCKDLMGQIAKGGEKTEFLAMSVLEQIFNDAYPLLLVNLQKIAEGDTSQVQAVQKLKQIFRENPYKALWEEKAEQYRRIIEKMGFRVNTTDYSNLTAIMEPLLDAFTLYQGRNHSYAPKIHKVRMGRRSSRRPEIGLHICKYSSEKELVDTVAGYGVECVIVFGAVEKTNRQVTDGFNDWYYGFPEERQRNYMYHNHISAEEYLNQVWDHSRCVYLCVKAAETIWLMAMPYRTDTYARYDDPESKYYAGCRAGYAPYEIFYKDIPGRETNTTFPSVPKKGYLLSELMDEQQKIWFPAFIEETIEKFFHSEPEADEWVLPEETAAVMPGIDNAEKKHILPIITNLPSSPRYIYEIKEPKEMFHEKYIQNLCEYFEINGENLLDVPVLPVTCGTQKEKDSFIEKRIKKAYIKILASRIADFLDSKWQIREWILDLINKNKDRIITQAVDGVFDSFMVMVIDGTPEKDKDGNPVMINDYRRSYREKPSIIHTRTRDCEEWRELKESVMPKILWLGDIPRGKAPVVWKIRPKTAAEYAAVLGMAEQELPDILKLSDPICWFYNEYKNDLPGELTNEWVAIRHDLHLEEKVCAYLPPLADINICMTKRTHKKCMAERNR